MRIRRDQGLIALVAAWGVLLFLLIVVFEDVVNSSLDPARHEISEYVHTPWGAERMLGEGKTIPEAAKEQGISEQTSGPPAPGGRDAPRPSLRQRALGMPGRWAASLHAASRADEGRR
jgi:hypothetical protein